MTPHSSVPESCKQSTLPIDSLLEVYSCSLTISITLQIDKLWPTYPTSESKGVRPRAPLSNRIKMLKSKVHEPSNLDLANQLMPNLKTLDEQFKTQHFLIVDAIDESDEA